MSSFHRADWLSAAQSIATLVAVCGAFGVIFVQERFQRRARRLGEEAAALAALELSTIFAEEALRSSEELETVVLIKTFHDAGRANAINVLTDRRSTFDQLQIHLLDLERKKAIGQVRTAMTKLISICTWQPPHPDEGDDRDLLPRVQAVTRELRYLLAVMRNQETYVAPSTLTK